MTTSIHEELHHDHVIWKAEVSHWRDDIELWRKELEQAEGQLKDLEESLKAHREALTAHASAIHDRMLAEARRIELEDQDMCAAIGRNGSTLIKSGMSILTHCNAGSLATAGDGTAQTVMFQAAREDRMGQIKDPQTE